jgi:hypothetical protein
VLPKTEKHEVIVTFSHRWKRVALKPGGWAYLGLGETVHYRPVLPISKRDKFT